MVPVLTDIAEFLRDYKEYALMACIVFGYGYQMRANVALRKDKDALRREKDKALEDLHKEKDAEVEQIRQEKDEAVENLHHEVLSLALASERNQREATEAIRGMKELLLVLDRRAQ